ncbi:MAG: hypothetical protein ACFFDU_01300 [Candidatus Thorarchaeota archaeon]
MSTNQAAKQSCKEALISLLAGVEPLIQGDTIFLEDLEIEITASGYANITINCPLDPAFFTKLFIRWDYYVDGSEASITVKPSENIFFYGDDGHQDIAFGPEFDRDLLYVVFLYIDRNFPGKYPIIRRWLEQNPLN